MEQEVLTKIKFKVKANARRDALLGVDEDGLVNVSIKARAVDNKANVALISFLSKELDIAKTSISLLRGHSSCFKILGFATLKKQELITKLQEK